MYMNINKDIIFRAVKIFDIGYVTVIYFLVGIFMAKAIDNYFGKFDKKKESNKSFLIRTLELIGMIWLYGIILYVVKNIIELLPSPFDDIGGFKHEQLKELKNATVFWFVFLFFQTHFKEKLQAYFDDIRLN